jgi:AhpD family alkylhydroperoxidase
MARDQIYRQMKEMLGTVPTMFKTLPDDILEQEWQLFKHNEIDEGPIPHKYRQLMGLALHAVSKCRYCTFFHAEMARLHGATDAEVEQALEYTKSSIGWSAYLTGHRLDLEQFQKEVGQICDHVRNIKMAKVG